MGRNAKNLYVRFTVDEGPQVRVSSVEFQRVDKGVIPYDPPFLRDSLSLRPGDPFRPASLRSDGRHLERMLGDAGYAVAAAEPDIQRNGDTARVLWKIKMGPRIRIGPIFVRGNFVTTDQTIVSLDWESGIDRIEVRTVCQCVPSVFFSATTLSGKGRE